MRRRRISFNALLPRLYVAQVCCNTVFLLDWQARRALKSTLVVLQQGCSGFHLRAGSVLLSSRLSPACMASTPPEYTLLSSLALMHKNPKGVAA
jgi:hypothetical protein